MRVWVVRGEEHPVPLEVRETRHGPLLDTFVSGSLRPEYVALPDEPSYSLSWVGLEHGIRPSLVLDVAHAPSFEAFRAAALEGLPVDAALEDWARAAHENPALLPTSAAGTALDLRLATLAATVAARRHGRPALPGEPPRPLADVGLLVGSGGVLRHAEPDAAEQVLGAVLADHGGGWRPPAQARAVSRRLCSGGAWSRTGRRGGGRGARRGGRGGQ